MCVLLSSSATRAPRWIRRSREYGGDVALRTPGGQGHEGRPTSCRTQSQRTTLPAPPTPPPPSSRIPVPPSRMQWYPHLILLQDYPAKPKTPLPPPPPTTTPPTSRTPPPLLDILLSVL